MGRSVRHTLLRGARRQGQAGQSNNTVKKGDLSHARSSRFFKRCAWHNLTEQLFCEIMGRPRTHPDRDITFLLQEEVKRLFAAIKGKQDRALFSLAYHHGLRASEVGLLQRTDLDLQQGRIHIHRLKDSSSGVYPLQPSDMKLLRAYLRTREDTSPYVFLSNRMLPMHRHTLWDATRTYGQRVGLPQTKQNFHILRHSIAVHLLDAGADIYFVKDWLGHKNIQNTMVYVQYTTATRDTQARRLFADHRVVS
jgi:type 1 fimbriae regulatory protein FimB